MDYRDPEWVAERLCVDKNTVYKFLQDGTIPALQLGRKWLISEASLTEWLANEATRQTQARREAASSTRRLAQRMANYSPPAQEAIRAAHEEARRYGHDYLGQEHIVLALAGSAESRAGRALSRAGIKPEDVRAQFEARAPAGAAPSGDRLARSPTARRTMRLAAHLAEAAGSDRIGTEHLLLAVLQSGAGAGHDILAALGLTLDSARHAVGQWSDPES